MATEIDTSVEETEVEQVDEGSVAIEKEAREMGWQPEDEWDGPKGKWINAKEFVDRGNHILPIVRANAKKMKDELLTRDAEVRTLRESLANANKTLEALRKAHTEDTKRQVDEAIADLRDRFKQAREVGDTDLELKIGKDIKTLEDKADKITEEHEDKAPEKKDEKREEVLSPEFIAWKAKNPWFGNEDDDDDMERSDRLMRIAGKLRKEGNTLKGLPFMEKCMELLEVREKGTSRRPTSKVEGGGNSRGGGGGSRAWDNLPSEAKAACHADNDTFVGSGKQFKTVKDWEDHYANLYNQ